jgi:hypothetical protein
VGNAGSRINQIPAIKKKKFTYPTFLYNLAILRGTQVLRNLGPFPARHVFRNIRRKRELEEKRFSDDKFPARDTESIGVHFFIIGDTGNHFWCWEGKWRHA